VAGIRRKYDVHLTQTGDTRTALIRFDSDGLMRADSADEKDRVDRPRAWFASSAHTLQQREGRRYRRISHRT